MRNNIGSLEVFGSDEKVKEKKGKANDYLSNKCKELDLAVSEYQLYPKIMAKVQKVVEIEKKIVAKVINVVILPKTTFNTMIGYAGFGIKGRLATIIEDEKGEAERSSEVGNVVVSKQVVTPVSGEESQKLPIARAVSFAKGGVEENDKENAGGVTGEENGKGLSRQSSTSERRRLSSVSNYIDKVFGSGVSDELLPKKDAMIH